MSQTTVSMEEIEWKGVPIKHCEFIRAQRKFSNMSRSDIEDTINNVTLSNLSEEDRDFIVKNISPTLEECIGGSRETRTTYLYNLMKLITYRYKQYKMKEIDAVKSSDLQKHEEYTQRVFHHYEALRRLKMHLIGGKELMFRDMPEVEVS
ncbi:MAG: hypothetical protein H3Z53_10315 [archaeon]|nr:hypothetical protein [archaeon]MCP8314742.1 hypothetical protein [archaeon]MCP8315461.1 hypothetical protein [archaeon]MCP8320530.1 hypothetical protein [archaeon]